MMKNSPNKSLRNRLILLICCIAMLPIMWISYYNHPTTDDYNFSDAYTWKIAHSDGSAIEIMSGAWKTMDGLYQSWQGTYSAFLLGPLHPGIYGTHEEFYKITTVVMLGNIFAACFFFVKEFLKCLKIEKKGSTIISVPIFLSIVEGLPSPVQGLFWYTGAMTYMLFWSWMIWGVALFLSALRDTKIKAWKLFVLVLGGFWISGGNHVTAFANILIILVFALIRMIRKKWNMIIYYLLPLLSSIIGFAVNAFAPGTRNRASLYEKQSVINTIVKSAIVGADNLVMTLRGPQVCLLILIGMLLIRHIVNEKNINLFQFRYFFGLMVLFYGLYCSMLCVPYYAMGFYGVGRIDNVRYASYIVMLVVLFIYLCGCIEVLWKKNCPQFATALVEEFSEKQKKIINIFLTIGLMIIISFFSGSIAGNVSYQSMKEVLSGEAQAYSKQCEEAIGHDVVDPVAKPQMIYYSTVDSDFDS